MPKFIPEIVGGLEIAAGVGLALLNGGFTPLAAMLITAGAGTIMGGLGTLLSKNQIPGSVLSLRNPIAPRDVIYGQIRHGGTPIFVNQWPQPGGGAGGNDQMVDMVFAIATHPCEAIDAVFFDNQRVQIDQSAAVYRGQVGGGPLGTGPYAGTGTSFTPVQQTVPITTIQRTNGVVTVSLSANIPFLIAGDRIKIQNLVNVSLNGTVPVDQILSQVVGSPGSIKFTYLNGGADTGVITPFGVGQAVTLWPDYGRTVYIEPLLGGQLLGQSFCGMIFGTPLDGDLGDIVKPEHTGGVQGQDQPNPWTSDFSGLGLTLVMLRIHLLTQYYSNGLPQVSFLVRGKNNVADCRTSPATVGYTNNWALCVADYLTTAEEWGGFGLEYGSDIPISFLSAAANTCDERVPLAISTASPPLTEAAYTLDGRFTLAEKRGEILQNMLTAAGGRLTRYQGQWILWPAAWTGVSFAIGSNPGGGVIPLGNFSQIAAQGSVKWRRISRRELFNAVKGKYVSASAKWQATDFPAYAQDSIHGYSGPSLYSGDANLQADGGDRLYKDIELPFTTDYARAQRLAKIDLLRSRQFWAGTLTLNMSAYQITPLDIIQLGTNAGDSVIPGQPWTSSSAGPALAEVTELRFKIIEGNEESGPSLAIEIDIQQVDTAIYDWSTLEELSPEGYPEPQFGNGFSFFATELLPGFDVPYPWKPGYASPLIGDAYFPGPKAGSPAQNEAFASFGLQVQNGTTNDGGPATIVSIKGTLPTNVLSSIAPPQVQITGSTAGGGDLPAGTYLIAAAAFDTNGAISALGVPQKITLPALSPPQNYSIAITVAWPAGSNGGEVFMAYSETLGSVRAVSAEGYSLQAQLPSSQTTLTITDFDQATTGAPDSTFDHLAIACRKVVHSGIWATSVGAVTSNTITLGGVLGINTNDYAGRVLSLLGRADATRELPVLNLPVLSNTLAAGPGNGGQQPATLEGIATTQPTNGQTVTIAGKTYTFQTTLTTGDGNVQISHVLRVTLSNLVAAINLDPAGAGTAYSSATLINPNATALLATPQFLVYGILLTAKQPGILGNALSASGGPFTWANSGGFSGGRSAGDFTVTIGQNSAGDQIADLTTLIETFDLMVMRFNATFGKQSFSDSLIANPFYPGGATGVEPGHVAVMLSGPNAGDMQVIESVNKDSNGNYTEFLLANPWTVQPNDGDWVIIVEAAWGPEYHTPADMPGTTTTGVVAAPAIQNLTGQTWLFIARSQNAADDNGDDAYAPMREVYVFGVQGTRTITSSQTLLTTDGIVLVDASAGPVTITIPPFSSIPNQGMYIQKIDSSSNPVTWMTSSPSDTINGFNMGQLISQWEPLVFFVGA